MRPSNEFYTAQYIDLDDNIVPEFKKYIEHWAKSIPHHPFRDLGHQSVITSVVHCPIYSVDILTQFELRSIAYHRVPYRQQLTPGRFPDFSNLYSLSLTKPTDFINQNYDHTFNGTVDICGTCGGDGNITCHGCNGARTFTCRTCRGERVVDCSACYGKGYNDCYTCGFDGQVSVYCPACNGMGRVPGPFTRCWSCNGTGRSNGSTCWSCSGRGQKQDLQNCSRCYGTSRVKVTCTQCNGTRRLRCYHCNSGQTTCGTCRGSGITNCRTCNGNGIVGCSGCDSRGRLINYAIVTQKFTSLKGSSNTRSNKLDRFPMLPFDKKRCRQNQPVLTISKKVLDKSWSLNHSGIDTIHHKIVSDAQQKTAENGPILFQDFHLWQLDAYIISCVYKESQYDVLLHGSDKRITDFNSPIELFKKKVIERGKSLHRENKFVESYEDMVRAREIDKSSGHESDAAKLVPLLKKKISRAYTFGIVTTTMLALYSCPLFIPLLKTIMGTADYTPTNSVVLVLSGLMLTQLPAAYLSQIICDRIYGTKVRSDKRRFLIGMGAMAFASVLTMTVWIFVLYY